MQKISLNLSIIICIISFCSCNTPDYIKGGENFVNNNKFTTTDTVLNIVAYNQKITPVAANDLDLNSIGIYENPAFGTTTANFNTQLSLESYPPNFGQNPIIDSVYLYVPYFSTLQETDPETGANTYKLDSIYGSGEAKIKLSIYESGYYMRNLDVSTGFANNQYYYTDQNSDFENLIVGNRINDSPIIAENEEFSFSPSEIIQTKTETTGSVTVTRKTPGMYLKLNTDFFKTKIINTDQSNLASVGAFQQYFRGLFFKVEKSGSYPSALASLNFQKGIITVYYKHDTSNTDITQTASTLNITMSGHTVNLFSKSGENQDYINALNSANTTLGDQMLYLKGGEGAMSVINLFGEDADNNGIADQLEFFRKQKLLVNEANLVFHINQSAVKDAVEPNRIYLYDLTNNRSLIDYIYDSTTDPINPKNNKLLFGGYIKKTTDGTNRGNTYKIRITNYITSLIKNADSTNVKLGLVVSEDIRNTTNKYLKTPIDKFTRVPSGSIMSPLGTVLYGSNVAIPEEKRLRLEIFYTKQK